MIMQENYQNQNIANDAENSEQKLKTAVEIVEQRIKASNAKPEKAEETLNPSVPVEIAPSTEKKLPTAIDIAIKKTSNILKIPVSETPPLKTAEEKLPTQIEIALKKTSETEKPLSFSAETALAIGRKLVAVQRSNGEIENDWFLAKGTNADSEELTVLKLELVPGTNKFNRLEKPISRKEFERLNPEYIQNKKKETFKIPASINTKEQIPNKQLEVIREEDEAMESAKQQLFAESEKQTRKEAEQLADVNKKIDQLRRLESKDKNDKIRQLESLNDERHMLFNSVFKKVSENKTDKNPINALKQEDLRLIEKHDEPYASETALSEEKQKMYDAESRKNSFIFYLRNKYGVSKADAEEMYLEKMFRSFGSLPEAKLRVKPTVEIQEKHQTPEQEVVSKTIKEVSSLSPEKRKSWLEGVAEFGYRTQEWKGNFFSNLYGAVQNHLTEKGKTHAEQSAVARFVGELRHSYEETTNQAREGRKKIHEGTLWDKTKHTGLSAATLVGNAALYGRVAYDAYSHIKGFNIANPLRYVTMTAMAFARGGEATKESILEGKKNIEKTRIEDENKAAEEAWAIYNKAKETAGIENREISREDLEHEYEKDLAKGIKKQFEESPISANKTLAQGLARRYLNQCMKSLNQELFNASYDSNNQSELKKREATALKKHAKLLKDLDRMIDYTGKINLIALGSDLLSKGGKAMAAAMAVETLYRGGMLLEQVQWRKLTAPFAEQAEKLISSLESQGDKLGVALGILETPDESSVHEIVEKASPKVAFRQDGELTEHSLKETANDIAQNSEKIDTENHLSAEEQQWIDDADKELKSYAKHKYLPEETEKELPEKSIQDTPAENMKTPPSETKTEETAHTNEETTSEKETADTKKSEMIDESTAIKPAQETEPLTENLPNQMESPSETQLDEQTTETPANELEQPSAEAETEKAESQANNMPPTEIQPELESDAETELKPAEAETSQTFTEPKTKIIAEENAPAAETDTAKTSQESQPEAVITNQDELITRHHIDTNKEVLQELGMSKFIVDTLPENMLAEIKPLQLNAYEIAYRDLGIGNFSDENAIQNYTVETMAILTSGHKPSIAEWIQEYRNAMLENGADNPTITQEYIDHRTAELQKYLDVKLPEITETEIPPQTTIPEELKMETNEAKEPEIPSETKETNAEKNSALIDEKAALNPKTPDTDALYAKKLEQLLNSGVSSKDIDALTKEETINLPENRIRDYAEWENKNAPPIPETPATDEILESDNKTSYTETQDNETTKTSPETKNAVEPEPNQNKSESDTIENQELKYNSSEKIEMMMKDPEISSAIETAKNNMLNQQAELKKIIERIEAANDSEQGSIASTLKMDKGTRAWQPKIQSAVLQELIKNPYKYSTYLPEEKTVIFEGETVVPGRPGDPVKEFIQPFKIKLFGGKS